MMQLPTVQQREAQIRAYAISKGIDPDVAVEVARSEGLQDGTWQSNVQQPYGRERSFGDFQLHVDPTGKNHGLGNQFQAATGLDPADPKNWEAMNRFALDTAAKGGWSPWMGAAKVGIKGKYGIGQAPNPVQPGLSAPPRASTVQPGLSAPMPPAPGLLDAPSQQAYSVSPSQEPGKMDWGALAKMAGQIGQKVQEDASQAQQPQQMQMLQPQVVQPLRRVTLGKGLLG